MGLTFAAMNELTRSRGTPAAARARYLAVKVLLDNHLIVVRGPAGVNPAAALPAARNRPRGRTGAGNRLPPAGRMAGC